MALTAEIDAFLAAGTAQGLDYAAMLQQLGERFGQTEYPDELVAISGSFQHTYATGTFADIRAYLADTNTVIPVEQAWTRAWGACMDNDLNMLCHYSLMLLRSMGRANLFNPAFPGFAMKSKTWGGKAWFSF